MSDCCAQKCLMSAFLLSVFLHSHTAHPRRAVMSSATRLRLVFLYILGAKLFNTILRKIITETLAYLADF